MDYLRITDWDTAYNNVNHIPDGESYPANWAEQAAHYRNTVDCELDIAYGSTPRETLDLFLPAQNPSGLFVFIHGGYWVRFDKSFWSHFAKGFNDAGWAVAMPSYSLCPQVSIADIEQQMAQAVQHAATKIDGPIILAGHSAGGQLVTSLVCEESNLSASVRARLTNVLSVSGVHDLRPLLNTKLNAELKLDLASATAASPVFRTPVAGTKLTALVGSAERPEFVRQNELLANIWLGLGASVSCIESPNKHHFNVINHLIDDKALVSGLIESS